MRLEKGIVYPRSEVALRHGAGVEVETTSPAEAYAPFPKWQLGPPASWAVLPGPDYATQGDTRSLP